MNYSILGYALNNLILGSRRGRCASWLLMPCSCGLALVKYQPYAKTRNFRERESKR
jgi:hypothetical protein